MKSGFTMTAVAALIMLSACATPPVERAYWQRVEDSSALFMTGPKAQQQLEQDMAGCVREVDELVELGALRKTTPPDTHSDYHKPLKASGDLDYYDTPTRYGDHMVSHTDFHDFESCMRYRGWERVNYIRYNTAAQAQKVYNNTQDIRIWGVTGEAAVQKQNETVQALKGDYQALNK